MAQDCETKIECGPYSEDPGDPCLGSDDPFCYYDGSEGPLDYEFTSGCYECLWYPEGENGEPSFYFCNNVPPGEGNGKPSKCTDHKYGCDMAGMCKLA